MSTLSNNHNVSEKQRRHRRALSMLEVLAVVAILGTIAAVAVYRFTQPSTTARRNACYMNKGNIEVQAQIWFRNKGSWATLQTMAQDLEYFPEGEPTCPVDGSKYEVDPATHRVKGHQH